MKLVFRMAESEFRQFISNSANRILHEDVLGDDWRQKEEEEIADNNAINNNYEPFDNHDWSTVGEKENDPTVYDPNVRYQLGPMRAS